jgi:hypothetical protein
VVGERCPNATLCLEAFHICKWASAALDEVRREVWNAARRGRQAALARELKDARFALWKMARRPDPPTEGEAGPDREDQPAPVPRLPSEGADQAGLPPPSTLARAAPPRPLAGLGTPLPTALLCLYGVGTDVAGALLVAAGDNPERMRSESAFAHLCGVAPLPASSGKTTGRHRLNRGGDRQANNALWHTVMVRLSCHQPTRDYMARRTTEGLSKKEIIRCLKRYVAREVYRAFVSSRELAPAA